ncbi:MAG: oxidative damage protection protein [Ignavibacteriaceae bacterium]|jgi:Fe-S cluster protector protein|nr:MAG: oxidative damage protection protein [Chlorobiota bacterium]KXK02254.1 MAG: putative Fe(2+)-trafficking protein [Chlorobi bacterium OLB4]MBV6397648.1 putative Fe(2+)-trafficking protein [Ignavibacteria bacterium]MCC6885612.1 oxidative damage protection protein [Ignavibacteriales bacterium]MCE7954009.1 oxidative damage protection protein [Chlorobi bacterium CHB7]MDL1887907.1 oxidative damage protection protein [Ignavibacteria bacterium CHB1]MEB2330572.1 oxidative damage protection prote
MTEVRLVNCIRFNKELPGLRKPPIPGELGEKIYQSVSKQAFEEFKEYFKMIVNEYRLDLTSPDTDKIFEDYLRDFFFGDGIKLPDQYIPPENKL